MTLVFTVAACGVLAWFVAVVLSTWALVRPPRLTYPRALARLGRTSPSDLGISFTDEVYTTTPDRGARSIKLAAWWMPAPRGNLAAGSSADSTVVLIHGYADSKTGALAWVPALHTAGLNVLAVDLRAHGESGGAFTTAGILERHDVSDIINALRAARPEATRRTLVMGVSMGAAVALAAACLRDDLSGVIVDSPVADFYHGATRQASLMGLAGPMVVRPGIWLIERLAGARFAEIRPSASIRSLGCPVLAIAPELDEFLPAQAREEMRAAVEVLARSQQESRFWLVEGAYHMQAMHQDPQKYVNRLQEFIRGVRGGGLVPTLPVGAMTPTQPDDRD